MNTLPGLRGLSDLADLAPVIVVDTREQAPLVFTRFRAVAGTLTTADYSVSGLEHMFAVERKTVDDLVGCCLGESRERFERELHRMRGFTFKRLLVVGDKADVEQHRYHSNIDPKSVLGSLNAWEVRFDVPAVWVSTAQDAAKQIETRAWYFCREVVVAANALLRGSRDQPRPQRERKPSRSGLSFWRPAERESPVQDARAQRKETTMTTSDTQTVLVQRGRAP